MNTREAARHESRCLDIPLFVSDTFSSTEHLKSTRAAAQHFLLPTGCIRRPHQEEINRAEPGAAAHQQDTHSRERRDTNPNPKKGGKFRPLFQNPMRVSSGNCNRGLI